MMDLRLLLALAFLAVPAAAAQESIDSLPTLSVAATSDSPYFYRGSDGRVAVVGEVENSNELTAMSGVVVRATFYDEGGDVIEVVRGTTLLDVVPSEGRSPYIIRSASADPSILHVSIDVETFDSAPSRIPELEVSIDGVRNLGDIEVSGTVRNASGVPSGDARVHLLFYDVFDPPRLLHAETVNLGGMLPGGALPLEFSGPFNDRAVRLVAVAESDVLVSQYVELDIPAQENLPPSRLVTISGVSASGPGGERARAGSPVDFTSTLVFMPAPGDRVQQFVYLVQVKRFGADPYVEFVGISEGAFYDSQSATASVSWVPERAGNYFVETFVWDGSFSALAPAGPTALVRVN